MTAAQPGRAYDWPLYQGTKQLKAVPMTKAEYCLLRGWQVPADEDPAEDGYCVEYQDGGQPNVDGFAGYVSWSPADVFERAYRPIGDYRDRLMLELDEVYQRIGKLANFIGTHAFDSLDQTKQGLMRAQLQAMKSYHQLLSTRFALEQEPGGQNQGGGKDAFIHDKPAVGVEPVAG